MNLRFYVNNAMIATLYVILVYVFAFMSFEAIQFRLAEALLIVFLFNKRTISGLLIGTFIANYLLSPIGLVDAFVGTSATLIALLLMQLVQSFWMKLLMPGIVNGIIIGLMLTLLYALPFVEMMFWVFLGETVVMLIVGYPFYLTLKKNTLFQELIDF
ncbi:MAG: QueT transporter family protein [Acholeplasmataceae bacterium]